MSSSMYEVFHWDDRSSFTGDTTDARNRPNKSQGTRLTKSRDSSLERRRIPPKSLYARSSTPEPPKVSSFSPVTDFSCDPLPLNNNKSSANNNNNNNFNSTSSPSADKNNSAQGSRLSVWEFGDNFSALGPSGGTSATTPTGGASTPTGSRYTRRTASVFTGSGCTYGGEFFLNNWSISLMPAAVECSFPYSPFFSLILVPVLKSFKYGRLLF